VDSTSLSESLDPEDLLEITEAYRKLCKTAILRHDGRVAQYLGDGVLAYFGDPIAHEDDARRATRAGLEIVSSLKNFGVVERFRKNKSSASGPKLVNVTEIHARVGIHTGPVVVGNIGGEQREQLAIGKTPNLAARIQSIAAPDTVVVSEDTFRLVRGFLEFKPLGPHRFKGITEVVNLHLALKESGADTRLDVERRSGLTPLIGRDEELSFLMRRWNDVAVSGGHTVLLQGEPGIGKSRIVDWLRQYVLDQSAAVIECFCTPYAQSAPLFPIVGMVERTLGFTRETSDAEKRSAIDQRLAMRGIFTEETSALMAGLLAIAPAGNDPLSHYSPQRRRERTLETLLQWLMAVARDSPTLLVIEDLHWVDPTTREFVDSVIRSLSDAPLLLILTFRPDFASPWNTSPRVTYLSPNRLAPGETSSMAIRVAGGKAIPFEVLKQIVARTEGIPLFVEEVTKSVLELGVLVEEEDRFVIQGQLPSDLIPATVHGSLEARLDRMGSAKTIAQIAATIGREFSYALLRAVVTSDESELREGLNRLTAAELVYRRTNSPEESYLFKHALLRDAAYASLLRKSRRTFHERIAQALIDRFPEISNQNPDLVAEHFSAAGCASQAVKSWLLAGRHAIGNAANHEAIRHLQRGLELIVELQAPDSLQQELELLVALIPALISTEGWAAASLERVYRRASNLVDQLGETTHRFTVLAGTTGYYFVSGRVSQSLELATQLLELSKKIADPLLLTVGYQNCSAVHCYHGTFRQSVEHAEAGLALFDVERERIIGRAFGVSASVGLLTYQYIDLWMMGYPARSVETSDRCVAVAREVGQASSLGFALTARTGSAYLQGDAKGVLTYAEEALHLVREERLGFFEPIITAYLGWGLSEMGDPLEGYARVRNAIDRYYAAGNGVQQTWLLTILAGVQWKAGNGDDAFETLSRAMSLAKINGEGLFEPELFRLQGEFMFARSIQGADGYILKAVELAHRQEARMLELRALTSLCRMRPDSRDMLAKAYEFFTEGMDTLDLREARQLLEH